MEDLCIAELISNMSEEEKDIIVQIILKYLNRDF